MKTRIFLAAVAVSALVLTQSLVAADKADSKFQAKCPVSGQPAKDSVTVEHHGKTVQFCCEGCPEKFKADPAKYQAKVALQLLGTKQMVQVACPFSGKPCNPEATVSVDGATVGFCCMNCKGKAEKADDKVALLFGGDLAKGFTMQAKCPVSGKPIDVTKSVDYQGKKVFFCCGGCPDAFQKDPAKFAAKLPQLSSK